MRGMSWDFSCMEQETSPESLSSWVFLQPYVRRGGEEEVCKNKGHEA